MFAAGSPAEVHERKECFSRFAAHARRGRSNHDRRPPSPRSKGHGRRRGGAPATRTGSCSTRTTGSAWVTCAGTSRSRARSPSFARRAPILLATSAEQAQRFELPANVDILRLPGLRKIENGRYAARRLKVDWRAVRWLRESLLLAAVVGFKPAVLLVDKHPLGLDGELEPALVQLRADGGRAVLGLRDVLDERAAVRAELEEPGLFERDRRALRPRAGLRPAGHPRRRVASTASRRPSPGSRASAATSSPPPSEADSNGTHPRNGRPHVLATAGGGEDGAALLTTFVEAAAHGRWHARRRLRPAVRPARGAAAGSARVARGRGLQAVRAQPRLGVPEPGRARLHGRLQHARRGCRERCLDDLRAAGRAADRAAHPRPRLRPPRAPHARRSATSSTRGPRRRGRLGARAGAFARAQRATSTSTAPAGRRRHLVELASASDRASGTSATSSSASRASPRPSSRPSSSSSSARASASPSSRCRGRASRSSTGSSRAAAPRRLPPAPRRSGEPLRVGARARPRVAHVAAWVAARSANRPVAAEAAERAAAAPGDRAAGRARTGRDRPPPRALRDRRRAARAPA